MRRMLGRMAKFTPERIDVHVHTGGDADVERKIDRVLALLTTLGVKMSALSDKVDAVLASEADEDTQHAAALAAKDAIIAELQSQVSDVSTQLTTALANDAADAQTIADKQASLDAQAADIQTQIDRLEAAFPSTPAEPPADVPPVDVPPVEPPA